MNKREIGKFGEDRAEFFLTNAGINILERNYRNRFGEVDIIAKDKDILLFIEVKYRKNISYGYPLESVNIHKQNKIKKIALYYLNEKMYDINTSIRFDCIGITDFEIEWIKGAF